MKHEIDSNNKTYIDDQIMKGLASYIQANEMNMRSIQNQVQANQKKNEDNFAEVRDLINQIAESIKPVVKFFENITFSGTAFMTLLKFVSLFGGAIIALYGLYLFIRK